MTQVNPFHAGYDEGQRQLIVGVKGLVEHLEGYGGGLPTEPMWRSGGPLVIQGPEKRTQVVAWMRGIPAREAGRPNVWEAWGVVGPAGSFGNWVSFWNLLAAEPDPENLQQLARAFAQNARGNSYPPVPQRLAAVLAKEYSNLSPGATRRIDIRSQSEVDLLPWCCLLGPVPVSEATVGPPRRMQMHVSTPPTYDGAIIDGPAADPGRLNASNSPIIDEMVAYATRGDIEAALMIANGLRRLSPAERQKQIFAPIPAASTKASSKPGRDAGNVPLAKGDGDIPIVEPEDDPIGRSLRRWSLTILLPAVAVLGLLHIAEFFAISRLADTVADLRDQLAAGSGSKPGTGGASNSSGGKTSTAAPATTSSAEAFDCNGWWTDSNARDQVFQALAKRVADRGWKLGGKAGPMVTNQVWDASSEKIITGLAVQLQIDDARCGQVGLDGDAGKGTQRAVDACGNSGHPIQQGGDALQWLCSWSSPQSNVAASSAGN